MDSKPETADELTAFLSEYTGTTQWYRHLSGATYTDGIQAMAQVSGGGAYWLVDKILFVGMSEKYRRVPFQLWHLDVYEDKTGRVMMREDVGSPTLYAEKLDYTDFPAGVWKFYLIDKVLLLPSEY